MKTPDIFDLYTDYLITSFSYTTATGLSCLVDNAISHDPVTRFLSQQDFTSKELGKVIKIILWYLTFSFFTLSFYVTKLGRLFDSFKGNRQACFL
jgi:hypothetical protein